MKPSNTLCLLLLIALSGCLASNDDDSANDDDVVDDDDTGDDDTSDDDDTGDDDTGDDDTGDDDDSTEPPPMDLGTVWTSTLVDFGAAPGPLSLGLPAADLGDAEALVSGALADSSGAAVGTVTTGSSELVTLSWDATGHDWRTENPVVLDLTLSLSTPSGLLEVSGRWAIEALPQEASILWDANGGWVLLPPALGLAASGAVGFGGTQLAPASEPTPGRWDLGAGAKPDYGQLNALCTSAGSGTETACFDSFSLQLSGAIASEVIATTRGGQTALITLVEPFDWDDDGDIDGDDVTSWDAGTAPCRTVSLSNQNAPYGVGASQHTIAGTLDVDGDARGAIGAPIDAVSATVSAYGSVGGSYAVGAPITAATLVDQGGGLYTLQLPPSALDFRVTNPATVFVELHAEDAGGRCYDGSHLITIGATPVETAMAWIDGALYLGTGGLVAPRPGNSIYFSNPSIYFGAVAEVETGIWELAATSEPTYADLDLLYFSAGERYATSYNESLLLGFSTVSTSPLVLECSIFGSLTGAVHFPVLTDLDGDGYVTPSDLRSYLDAL